MFTVCPKCTLTLAVTAGDLRVGQGYVRCGRCSNVFNALLKLSEAPAEGSGAELPELPQADPASTSQIHRAITAAALDGSAAGGSAAAAAAARAPPRPLPARSAHTASAPPATLSRGAAAAVPPASGGPAVAAPDAPAPRASLPATSAAPAPASASASAPAPAPAAPSTGPAGSAAVMRRRSSDWSLDAQQADVGSMAQALRKPAVPTSAAGVPAPERRATSGTSGSARFEAPAAPGASAQVPAAAAALPGAAPGKESDADAMDQFELVLQTLGLDPDGEEPPLPGLESEPTQTVENIVLEGDEVRQSEARVPDEPLDELDLFTRRLGVASGEHHEAASAAHSSGAAPHADEAADTRPRPRTAGSLAARRAARLAQATRRSTDSVAGADAGLAAARAAGRDPGVGAAGAVGLDESDAAALADLPTDLDIPGLGKQTRLQQRLWLGGCVALLVLLLAQLVNHWRDALTASPTWGHPVSGLYAALGAPLRPNWDLSAYEVHQQGAESEGGPQAAIRVRFSLANHATRAQPVPLLRLTLLDRYGRRVAERTLTPADYWPKGRSPERFLAADERVDTEVQVRDPSADSASFELDVCLPDAPGGGVHCAGDSAAGSASATP